MSGLIVLFGYGLQVAGGAAVGLGMLWGTEGAAELQLDPNHGHILLGPVVGKRDFGLSGEPQNFDLVAG